MEIIETRKKHNRITMINSAAIFIASYLVVFYLYQIFTLIPAFALQVSNVFYTGRIDFDTVTSAASSEVWQDAENIFAVFGTSPLVIIFFVILNIFALTGKTIKLNQSLKIFCFWNIINCIIRFFGNFSLGHIFGLWSSNLVTDFLEVSYPNKAMALVCVMIALLLAFLCIRSTIRVVKHVFNPFLGGVKEKTLYNILYPALIGIGFLFFFFCLPHINENELGIFTLLICSVCLIFLLIKHKYGNIPEKRENLGIILNRPLIIGILIFSLIKIVTDKGIFIPASAYRQQIIERFIFITFSIVSLIIIFSIISHYYKKHRAQKQMREQARKMFKENNSNIDHDFWGVKTHDMDKYKDVL